MFTRVVRFTDVTQDRMDALRARIEAEDGPPEGVPDSSLTILFDADQGTAVVLQGFRSREDLETAAKVFDAMDAGDTPGTRASVDACETAVEVSVL